MYEIKEIQNKEEWEFFLSKQKFVLMTQSTKYGEFYSSMNEKHWLFGVYDSGKLVAGSLIVSVHAKRGNFLFAPYGPIINQDYENILKLFIDFLKEKAKKEHYVFVRVSPFIDDLDTNKDIYQKLGFKKSPIHALAETTWLLDLTKSEEEILANMNKNHRNLINRCLREKVKVIFSNDKKALEEFNILHDYTSKKHNFTRFSNSYVEKEFLAFQKDDEVSVLKAYLQNNPKLDSSAVVYFYGNSAAYRHGASLVQDKKIPTSYILQWSAIQEAKKRGLKYYNFWGIAPDNAPTNHPFKGITHFKKGFGGFQKNLLPCQDFVISPKYFFTWIIETIRSKKRGF
ncbi:MAG: peptidoglycan bridge formation glycyltransferase FemA/FemB family protein [Candidatus Magasanikbacteria bacterium]